MKKNYTVKLDGKEWESILDHAFKHVSKEVNVDGFRKGQVPRDIYIKKFGVAHLYDHAIDDALPLMLDKLLEDPETLRPACTPQVNLKSIDDKSIEVEFTIISMPEVKLGKYKNSDLNIKKKEVKVTKEETNHEIEHLKEQFAELKSTDQKIKEGNIAVIDFEGFKDGVAFDGGKGENHSLTIGSHTFIPGFEEGLVGLKKGDEKDLELTFPENYHVDDLKGQKVVFKVKVNDVKERIVPELNDDFFKDLGMEGINTKESLEEEIKKNLEVNKERQIEEEYILECLDKVMENAKYEIDEEIINDEAERIYHEFSERLSMQGMDINQYLKITNSTKEALVEQMKPEAKKRVSYRLVVDAVAEKEGIKVTKEELEKEITNMIERYGITKEELIKNVGSEEAIEYDMRMKRALEVITGIKKEEK